MRTPCTARYPALAAVLIFAAVLIAGCAGTPQPEVSYDAYAAPTPPGEIQAGEWTVTLDEAVLALGPVYFCEAASGSATLCDAAIAELPAVARVDALTDEPQRLGRVRGFEGTIRSASFDYGITWFATQSSFAPALAAPGGHSARFRGRAVRGAEAIAFTADVDVLPPYQGQRAITSCAVPRCDTDPRIASPVTVGAADVRLEVHVDVGPWVASIDFGALEEAEPGRVFIGREPRDDEAPHNPKAHERIVFGMVNQHWPEFLWTDVR